MSLVMHMHPNLRTLERLFLVVARLDLLLQTTEAYLIPSELVILLPQ